MLRRSTTKLLTGKRKRKSRNLATLANAENDSLVNILADWLSDVEVETVGEEKAKKETEAQVGTLAEKITECK